MKFYIYHEDLGWGLVGPFDSRELAEAHPNPFKGEPGHHYEIVSEHIVQHIDSVAVYSPARDIQMQQQEGLLK